MFGKIVRVLGELRFCFSAGSRVSILTLGKCYGFFLLFLCINIKARPLPSKKNSCICFNQKNPLKMMKNSSYFILKVKATKQRQIVSDLFLFLKIFI